MQPKYFNTMRIYLPTLQQCVAERLWIRTGRHWYGPYDWAWKFGVSYFGLNWEPKLADPPTYDENGVVLTKAGGPKTTAFLRLGPTQSNQWYLINGNCLGDFNDLQVDLELNYDSPASIVQNCKIDSSVFAIPLYSENTRANDQFYLLMEAAFDSLTFEDITFSEITVERTESLAAIEIDEDNQSFIIALDGDIPTDMGEDEVIELSTPFFTSIELSTPFTTLVTLNSIIR